MTKTMVNFSEGAGSRLMFGSGASAATQSVYFDYVRYTVDGEFTPGRVRHERLGGGLRRRRRR